MTQNRSRTASRTASRNTPRNTSRNASRTRSTCGNNNVCPITYNTIPAHRKIVINKQSYDANALLTWYVQQATAMRGNRQPKVPHTQRPFTSQQYLNVLAKTNGQSMTPTDRLSYVAATLTAPALIFQDRLKAFADKVFRIIQSGRLQGQQVVEYINKFGLHALDSPHQITDETYRVLDVSAEAHRVGVGRTGLAWIYSMRVSMYPTYYKSRQHAYPSIITIALDFVSDAFGYIRNINEVYFEDRKFKNIATPFDAFSLVDIVTGAVDWKFKQVSGPRLNMNQL